MTALTTPAIVDAGPRQSHYLGGHRHGARSPRSSSQETRRREIEMSNATSLVQRYFEIWNEQDPNIRLAAVELLWTDDARYVDPVAAVRGHREITDLIGAVQRQVPGHV